MSFTEEWAGLDYPDVTSSSASWLRPNTSAPRGWSNKFSSSSPVTTFRFAKTMGRSRISRRDVGLYILASPITMRSARVVEQVLIQLCAGHYFSLRENLGRSWIIRRNVGLCILAPPKHKRSARVVEQVLIQLLRSLLFASRKPWAGLDYPDLTSGSTSWLRPNNALRAGSRTSSHPALRSLLFASRRPWAGLDYADVTSALHLGSAQQCAPRG